MSCRCDGTWNTSEGWLVQVPAAVAKVWQERAREAIRGNRQVLLGALQQEPQTGKRVLELADGGDSQVDRIPKRYKVEQAAAGTAVPTFLFSSTTEGVCAILDPSLLAGGLLLTHINIHVPITMHRCGCA